MIRPQYSRGPDACQVRPAGTFPRRARLRKQGGDGHEKKDGRPADGPVGAGPGGLNCAPASFAEGETPGDVEGGEAYTFTPEDGPGFSYVLTGPEEAWLLAEGAWYAVRNPSVPPVELPGG